jgi:ADP-L-glycero-D-manno-heptose 6-epimerase
MILVTGGLGLIGANLIYTLNKKSNLKDIIIADNLSTITREKILNVSRFNLEFSEIVDLYKIPHLDWEKIDFVFHIGARSNTMEDDYNLIYDLNYFSSKMLSFLCKKHNVPFIYASSAATYGDGKMGYSDTTHPNDLMPLNLYGHTKNDFDRYMLDEDNDIPKTWYGFKFFNVFGYGEFHKERMASVIYHGFNQLKKDGVIKLFKSHKEGIEDGEQKRDFIYVEDLVNVLYDFYIHRPENGIYNLGTGKARSFLDLAKQIVRSYGSGEIQFIDMPESLRGKYQYFTESDNNKLYSTGLIDSDYFHSLEDSVDMYIKYLKNE